MEKSILEAAESPWGGADLIARLIKEDPKKGRKAIKVCGGELLRLMSRSPCDLADLFDKLDSKTRKLLYSKFSFDSLANMSRSPGDWNRILKSLEG